MRAEQPVDDEAKARRRRGLTRGAQARAVEWMVDRPVPAIALYLLVGAALILSVSWKQITDMNETAAVGAARSYAQALTTTRDFYAREIVPRAKKAGARLSHDYRATEDTIPFPVTMSIDLGQALTRAGTDIEYRLYSHFPFPWRSDRMLDEFEIEALNRLTAKAAASYHRFEDRPDGRFIRFAEPVVMKEACLGCHNGMAESPYRNWKAGEVRGIQQVTLRVPDSSTIAYISTGLYAAICALALALVWFLLRRLGAALARTRQMAHEAEERNVALHEARTEADRANIAKSQFLATMSHDLRTPLNSIIGFSEVIRIVIGAPDADERVKEYADDIHTSGQYLLDLLNDILDMSKIEAGMLELSEDELSFRECAEDSVRLMNQRAADRGVTLALNGPGGAAFIRADRRRIKQLLLNLLSNAIKFTPAGGTVELSFTLRNGLSFSVRDTGIGMSPEDIASAMLPFGQIDNDLTRQHDGTGLGLPICRALTELHHGTMTLESTVGEGTTVTVSLPAERMGAGREARESAA